LSRAIEGKSVKHFDETRKYAGSMCQCCFIFASNAFPY
jgi:hypothetical protein